MVAGAVAVERVVTSLVKIAPQWGEDPHPQMSLAMLDSTRLGSLWGIPVVVYGVLVVALGVAAEEIFFRGYMQGRLRELWGSALSVAITSICFGLSHGVSVKAAVLIAAGVYFGYVTELSGSIRPAMLCHLIYNVFWTILWLVAPYLGVMGPPGELATTVINNLLTSVVAGSVWTNVVWLAAGGTILAGCIMWLRRTTALPTHR